MILRGIGDLEGLVRFRPFASGLEASWWARSNGPGSGRMQPARYQFPTFRLGCLLPQTALIVLCKTSLGPIWFWLTVSGLDQTDPVWKQAGVQESRGRPHGQSFRVTPGELDPACLLG